MTKTPLEHLQPYRDRIDEIDDRIVDLLAARTDIIREVAALKFRENLPAVLQDRVDAVRERAAARAADGNLDPDLVRALYRQIVAFSCDLEDSLMAGMASDKKAARL